MTNKELEAKVINAQSAVAKREAVLAKHREQLAKLIAKGADQYDIRYKEDDIKTATGKLEDARRILKNWQDKLGAQISRDAFIEANAPQVIKDFLERWKASAIIYYRQRRIDFIEYRKELRQKEREARLEALHTLPELERYRQIYKDREPSDSDLVDLAPSGRRGVSEGARPRLSQHPRETRRQDRSDHQPAARDPRRNRARAVARKRPRGREKGQARRPDQSDQQGRRYDHGRLRSGHRRQGRHQRSHHRDRRQGRGRDLRCGGL